MVLIGGGYGALVFGGAVSLLHLLHNRVEGVRDALAIWGLLRSVGGDSRRLLPPRSGCSFTE